MMFGTPLPEGNVTDVPIDADAGEVLRGFIVRADDSIKAIKVVTSLKRSAWLGDTELGTTFDLTPPQGYRTIGVYGRYGQCCDGFGVVYTSAT